MPGVPPNALSKLKSALKGILKGGNKQKKQDQQEQKKPTAASTATPATTSTSAAAPAAAAAPVAAASTSTQQTKTQDSAPAPAELKSETAPEPVVAGGPEGSQTAKGEIGSKPAAPAAEPTSAVPQTDAGLSKATEPVAAAPTSAANEEKIVAEPAKVDGATEDATGTTAGTRARGL